MKLISSIATEREWCNWCPDLILPGEAVATGDELRNPLLPDEPGYAHADCARSRGHEVTVPGVGAGKEIHLRQVVRSAVRMNESRSNR